MVQSALVLCLFGYIRETCETVTDELTLLDQIISPWPATTRIDATWPPTTIQGVMAVQVKTMVSPDTLELVIMTTKPKTTEPSTILQTTTVPSPSPTTEKTAMVPITELNTALLLSAIIESTQRATKTEESTSLQVTAAEESLLLNVRQSTAMPASIKVESTPMDGVKEQSTTLQISAVLSPIIMETVVISRTMINTTVPPPVITESTVITTKTEEPTLLQGTNVQQIVVISSILQIPAMPMLKSTPVAGVQEQSTTLKTRTVPLLTIEKAVIILRTGLNTAVLPLAVIESTSTTKTGADLTSTICNCHNFRRDCIIEYDTNHCNASNNDSRINSHDIYGWKRTVHFCKNHNDIAITHNGGNNKTKYTTAVILRI
jgi:hypothetical protein